MILKKINITSALLVVASTLSVSPLMFNYSPLRPNIVSLIALFLIFLIKLYEVYIVKSLIPGHAFIRVSVINLVMLSFLLFMGVIHSLYWGAFTARLPIYFISSLLILPLLEKLDIENYTSYLSKILLLVLPLAILGFVYAIYGGESLFVIPNEDSRLNKFYLSTFSNSYYQGFIRPSGFFDEPGALSFYICMVVALRETLGMNRNISWILLILGFITTSLAHLAFVFLFWLKAIGLSVGRLLLSLSCILLVLYALTLIDSPVSAIIDSMLWRLKIEDGMILGDNRMPLIKNAFHYLDYKSFFFGLDVSCMLNLPDCSQHRYLQYGENPFTLIVHWGILLALPYILIQFYLLKCSIFNKDTLPLGVFLLLLQRPNVMSYGYSVIIMLYLFTTFKIRSINVDTKSPSNLT